MIIALILHEGPIFRPAQVCHCQGFPRLVPHRDIEPRFGNPGSKHLQTDQAFRTRERPPTHLVGCLAELLRTTIPCPRHRHEPQFIHGRESFGAGHQRVPQGDQVIEVERAGEL